VRRFTSLHQKLFRRNLSLSQKILDLLFEVLKPNELDKTKPSNNL
jgi:hypothetical protein